MIATLSPERRTRALEFGIYRDGDNNLDDIQSIVLDQAIEVSAKQPSIEFTVEDTDMVDTEDTLSTQSYRLDDGQEFSFKESPMHDMSSRANLAQFVARTLDNAEKSGAKETWIDLVDHGAGDGGGLEADHAGGGPPTPGGRHVGIMREDDMAGAIADGVALHAKAHPEDAGRRVDGVVANQCMMATLGFSSGYVTLRAKRPARCRALRSRQPVPLPCARRSARCAAIVARCGARVALRLLRGAVRLVTVARRFVHRFAITSL